MLGFATSGFHFSLITSHLRPTSFNTVCVVFNATPPHSQVILQGNMPEGARRPRGVESTRVQRPPDRGKVRENETRRLLWRRHRIGKMKESADLIRSRITPAHQREDKLIRNAPQEVLFQQAVPLATHDPAHLSVR